MPETIDAKEAIRLALLYAIDDRTSYLEALGGYNDNGIADRTKAQIKAFRGVLRRRYGERPDPMKGCETVSVFDHKRGKFRKF